MATNGEPRRGSDQEPADFIGCGSLSAPPSSPLGQAGREWSGTRVLEGSAALWFAGSELRDSDVQALETEE